MKRPSQWILTGLLAVALAPLQAGVDEEISPVDEPDDWFVLPMREATLEDIGIDPDQVDYSDAQSLTTNSDSYDPTIISKFIPGSAFVPGGGSATNQNFISRGTGGCIYPGAPGSTTTTVYAPIELPGNSLLISAVFYLRDDDNTYNIVASLRRVGMRSFINLGLPGGISWTRQENDILVSGNTADSTGWTASVLDVDPDVVTGIVTGPILLSSTVRFFTAQVSMRTSAGANHQLCGVRVNYQVPKTGDNQAFTPINPCRIFDSRPTEGGTGIFAAGETRTIQVTANTAAQGGEGLCGIPSTATAVETNISLTQPLAQGSLKLWAPSAAEPRALLNFSPALNLWNSAATVPISSGAGVTGKGMNIRTVFGGAHVVLNVTGYYSPVSNMGN